MVDNEELEDFSNFKYLKLSESLGKLLTTDLSQWSNKYKMELLRHAVDMLDLSLFEYAVLSLKDSTLVPDYSKEVIRSGNVRFVQCMLTHWGLYARVLIEAVRANRPQSMDIIQQFKHNSEITLNVSRNVTYEIEKDLVMHMRSMVA